MNSDDFKKAVEDKSPSWPGIELLLESREWLEAALNLSGATITGSGINRQGADVSCVVDGIHFWVTMKVSAAQSGTTQ